MAYYLQQIEKPFHLHFDLQNKMIRLYILFRELRVNFNIKIWKQNLHQSVQIMQIMDSERNQLLKRTQQAQSRMKSFEKVNSELTRIIQLTQISQYKQLLTRLSQQQRSTSSTINQLQMRISHLQTELSFTESRHCTIVAQLSSQIQSSSGIICELKKSIFQVIAENKKLKKQLKFNKSLVRNQEHLIDEYKKSIQEQMEIQREIAKCEVKQMQVTMKRQMETQIQQMKCKYKQQLAKASIKKVASEYKKEMKNLALFLSDKKSHKSKKQDRQQDQSCILIDQNYQSNSKKNQLNIFNSRYPSKQPNSLQSTLQCNQSKLFGNINDSKIGSNLLKENVYSQTSTKQSLEAKLKQFMSLKDQNSRKKKYSHKQKQILGPKISLNNKETPTVFKQITPSEDIEAQKMAQTNQNMTGNDVKYKGQTSQNDRRYANSAFGCFKQNSGAQNCYIIDEFREDQF